MGKGEVEALHDAYCAGYHNLPRRVKRHLSLHDMQEIWFHMVRPVVDTLTAEVESLKTDAERYRKVRRDPAMLLHLRNTEFDSAIDAQAKAEPQEKDQ